MNITIKNAENISETFGVSNEFVSQIQDIAAEAAEFFRGKGEIRKTSILEKTLEIINEKGIELNARELGCTCFTIGHACGRTEVMAALGPLGRSLLE